MYTLSYYGQFQAVHVSEITWEILNENKKLFVCIDLLQVRK